ncbi:hypothetical protein ANN_08687 [Periplaneta americana]|uniref:Uncharacterized protein n=1 Tax=Periplaneta americana TaxID=6978 RepID=A0ABQ8T246_PERAM|nr:hypothetical protein ANN_08687 [Periplaneta americana]
MAGLFEGGNELAVFLKPFFRLSELCSHVTVCVMFDVTTKFYGSGGIRTHASEETGALNQRLRPLGHATTRTAALNSTTISCACSSQVLRLQPDDSVKEALFLYL